MKKTVLSFFLVACGLTACSDNSSDINTDSSKSASTITVSPETFSNINQNAQELILTVTADADWNITSNASWISVVPGGGIKNVTTDVTLYLKENTGMETRVGEVTIKSGNTAKVVTVNQFASDVVEVSTASLMCGGAQSSFSVEVNANVAWTVSSNESWVAMTPASGTPGSTTLTINVDANADAAERTATVVINGGTSSATITITQLAEVINIPTGYNLVWHDEFDGNALSNDWTYEVQGSGWVNNELQNYVKTPIDGKNTVEVNNGLLSINCFKGSDGKVYSGRIYANVKSGWTYGYIEASINLPSGKGTWPAFWMMPVNFTGWPDSGEMDIMEEVGTVPNEVSSSLHALGHYHANGTQITAARTLPGAEGSFHTYAMEWTPDNITTYVDGVKLLSYDNDGSGDLNWPYHNPFYVIFNLAWGGDWGGMNGVDENALPVSLLVDYVRVFQKP